MAERTVEFHISKNSLTGKSIVKAVVPPRSTIEDIRRVQEILFTDILPDIGLEGHPICLSGLDGFTVEEAYQKVIEVTF